MSTQHTPGPWRFLEATQTVVSNQSHPIARLTEPFHRQVNGGTGNDGPLIAAAPDLLAALRDLELGANTVDGCYTRNPGNFAAALRDLREYADKARAAIEKATGSVRAPSNVAGPDEEERGAT